MQNTTMTVATGALPASLLNDVMTELGAYYLERTPEITGLLVGLLAKQHVLLYGPPGTGKSDLIRAVASHIDGVSRFEKLLTKFTSPEEVEGPFDIPQMMLGNYVRKRAGHLTDSKIVFLDEIFKANSAILNTMLSVMNERIYHEEGKAHRAELHTLVGASNELPESKELAAFADRFVLKFETAYLTPSNRAKLHRRTDDGYSPTTIIDMAGIEALQKLVPLVDFPEAVAKQYDKLLASAEAEGLKISDRATRHAKRVMQAHAVLQGRTAVTDDDIEVLENVLWREPKDRVVVRRLVGACVNPLKAKANEFIDQAMGVYDVLRPLFTQASTAAAKTQAIDANSKLDNIQQELSNYIASQGGGNVAPLEKARERIEALTANVVKFMMGKRDRMEDL